MRSRASLVKSGDLGRDPGTSSTSGETQGRCADLRFAQKTPSIWDFPLFGFSVFLLLKYVSFLAASPAFRWQPPAGRAARETCNATARKRRRTPSTALQLVVSRFKSGLPPNGNKPTLGAFLIRAHSFDTSASLAGIIVASHGSARSTTMPSWRSAS